MTRPIDQIIIHCSATPNGRHNDADDIDAWHIVRKFHRTAEARRHFNPQYQAIGYHYVILLNGDVQTGRSIGEVGAHTIGHNVRSIGICLIGTDRFTTAQWESLANLVYQLHIDFKAATVHGHREFAAKECPGFDVGEWMESGGTQALADHVFES